MNLVSQDDAHSTTELCPLNHQINFDGRDDQTRNSLYIRVENSQIWCDLKFGIILHKNHRDEICSDNNYKCVLSYEDLNPPSNGNVKISNFTQNMLKEHILCA